MFTKLILSFTAALLLTSLPALAAIDIYGAAHVSLDAAANDDPDPAHEDRTLALTSDQSYLGLRGRELLRGQTAAIWQVENAISFDAGGWGAGRDTFVGLQTGFGAVSIGRQSTPYRTATDELDVFADTRADYNAVIGSVGGESLFNNRANNSLLYATPPDKRLRFALAYSTNVAGSDDLPLTKNESRKTGLSLALVFDSGPLYLAYGYESLGEVKGSGLDAGKAKKFGAGWDYGQGTQLAFIWEDADSGELISGLRMARQAYYANLAQIYGNVTYKLAYGRLGNLDSASESGADYAALGASYVASARTEFYLLYAAVMNDASGGYGLHPDHDGGSAIAALGRDASALSAGLIHRFDLDL